MKNSVKVCLIFLLLSNQAFSQKEEKISNLNCQFREPKVSVEQAIDIAREASKQYFPNEGSFIDMAQFVCIDSLPKWKIGLRRKAYESGHLIVYINRDKTTEITMLKDG